MDHTVEPLYKGQARGGSYSGASQARDGSYSAVEPLYKGQARGGSYSGASLQGTS